MGLPQPSQQRRHFFSISQAPRGIPSCRRGPFVSKCHLPVSLTVEAPGAGGRSLGGWDRFERLLLSEVSVPPPPQAPERPAPAIACVSTQGSAPRDQRGLAENFRRHRVGLGAGGRGWDWTILVIL